MKPHITRRTALTALACAASVAPGLSLAQSERPVKFILPNATGSGVDAITRAAAPALGKALGTTVVVENQAGAGGVVGLQALTKNPPDGYTLSVVSNNVVIFPSVLKSLPFDMPGDFTPIAIVGSTPMVLVVNPQKVSATNGREFIAQLKAKPDSYNFGSGGNGTILHLAAEMFLDEAKVTARHIPYKGVGPMVTDLLGGQIDFAVVATPSVQQHIKSGALRAIGMCGDKRTTALPDVPTFVEQGLPGYVMEAWFAVVGPKGMTPAAVKKVHDAVVAAFNDAGVRETMAKQGNTINVSSTEQAQKGFRTELAKYAALVKKAGITPE
ncbi:Bug family tripartite tricarboxylate transporter substrate binding protein [Limnohabitans radicicola]|uniref:Tripartite tricarboxylate transporter substrate binding protein n=1 Tax=Limnohabitans radicicola TaxID=2771427 RepID=A0A927FGB0_9BURK|nr:tripartite tricarboxylate transporter substrate-binding protein [Limnohabitans radicicola]MBD8050042.1 tripartite tricarboxylate transporter substrate binding protein [Limnohabitans radicicola]